jgi:hypothetical protein
MTSTSTLAFETIIRVVERLKKLVIDNDDRPVILSDKVVEEGRLLTALLRRRFPAMIGDLIPVILPLCVCLVIRVLPSSYIVVPILSRQRRRVKSTSL